MKRLLRDERGSIAMLSAAALSILLGGAATAIDLGSLFVESRRLQGITDAAALAAANAPDRMNAEARAAVDAARPPRAIDTTLTPGTWNPDAPAATRFTAGASGVNAVRVVGREIAPLFFARAFGMSGVTLTRTATAARIDLAAFSLGSRLASVDGGVANALLGALAGGSLSLSAADYRALADADVDLLAFADALRTRANLQGASFDQAIGGAVTLPQALAALGTTLQQAGSNAAAAAARAIGARAGSTTIDLSQLIDVGPIGAQDHAGQTLAVQINAYDLARNMILITGGKRQVDVALAGGVPGLADVTLHLAVGQRMQSSPWVAVTPAGDPIVRTAQLRLSVEARVAGPAILGGSLIRIPLYLDMAEAQARLASIGCGGGMRWASLSAQASPGHAALAEVSDMTGTPRETSARIVTLGLLAVTADARADLAGNGWQQVDFAPGEVEARAIRTISSSGPVGALTTSLAGSARVGVSVAGLPTINLPVASAVQATLTSAAPAIDGLLAQISALLGLQLGRADLRIDGVRCGQAALVA